MSCETIGEWVPVPDTSTPCVKEIVNDAVKKHNEEIIATGGNSGDLLTLNKIISGTIKEIDDNTTEHKFYIEATNGNGVVGTYEPHVLVEEKDGTRVRTLLSFPQGYKDEKGQFWIRIPDVDESCVQDVSKWAVEQHNKDANDNLIYVSTLEGYYYEVNPHAIRFILHIKAKDCFGRWRIYIAIVLEEKPLTEKIRTLEFFKPIPRKS